MAKEALLYVPTAIMAQPIYDRTMSSPNHPNITQMNDGSSYCGLVSNPVIDPINPSICHLNETFIGLTDETDPDLNLLNFNSNPSAYYLEESFNNLTIKNNLQNNIKILHINIRSYSKNQAGLWTYIDNLNSKFHIIALTEIWTNPNNEDLLYRPGYKTFTKSRLNRDGGGVALLVDESFQSELFTSAPDVITAFEWVSVLITPPSSKPFLVGSVYRPPDSDLIKFQTDLEDFMTSLDKYNKTSYLCGDFNLNLLNIDSHYQTNDFLNLMSTHLFRPLISVPTRITATSSTLIDNIFTNSFNTKDYPGVFMTDISDHLPIFAIIDLKTIITSKVKFISYRPTSDNLINGFINTLNNENWSEMIKLKDPDHILESFNNKLFSLYESHFPLITKKARQYKNKMKPWMSPSLIKSCKTKNKLYKTYLTTRTDLALYKYKIYKNKLTTILRKCEKQYYADKLELYKSNLRETWRILKVVLNHQAGNHVNIPLKINETLIDDPNIISNEFNDYFVSIGPKMAESVPLANHNYLHYLNNPLSKSMFLNPVTTDEVNDIILNLKTTKPYDSAELPINIIKKISSLISKPLVYLINQSFVTGIVPKTMKIAVISPIFKAGDIHDKKNYRPISKLTIFSKILERAMHTRLNAFLERNKLLHNNQFGFRKNHSTTHALIEVVDKISEAIDDRKITVGVFLDLSKAFDTIKHDILFSKLAHYGIRGVALDWFKSYFTDRFQQVKYFNSLSKLALIRCGVPQGSILGPLLFLIYINDITTCSNKLTMYLFADDTTVFITNFNYPHLINTINKELMLLSNWLNSNFLSLNTKKSNYIVFTGPRIIILDDHNLTININNNPIERVSQSKFLGILIDEHLSWHPHITLVKNKLAKSIGILKRLKHTLPSRILKTLYNTLMLPHLNYGTILWASGYKTPITPLLLLQKKIIRIIAGQHYLASTINLFPRFNILNIFDLYKLQVASFMYLFHNNYLPTNFSNYFKTNNSIHSHNTRASINLHIESCRTNIRYFTIRMAGPRIWNNLDSCTRASISIHSFKRALKKILLNESNLLMNIFDNHI